MGEVIIKKVQWVFSLVIYGQKTSDFVIWYLVILYYDFDFVLN